ncbi:MAG: HAD family phosphatase [Bradyrhizobium sp.]|nr:MAG: HAD family phosphatase [Bradyrhizobium sp.]
MTAALLFDLDGTLIDSDPVHLRAFQSVFAAHGVAVDQAIFTARIQGFGNAAIGDYFLPHLSEADRAAALEAKEAHFRQSLEGAEPIAGIGALLDFAAARDVDCAVVTNAPRANVEAELAALGLIERLTVWVLGSELERPKPDPLPYLTALERMGAEAGRSLAFEDSLSGLNAARDAGLAVVGLTTTLPADRLLAAGAVLAVANFADPRLVPLIESRIAIARKDA